MDSAYVPLLIVAAAVAAVSLLQFVMTHVGATQGMGPNRMAGIRTKATLASDDAWRAGHAAAQPALLAAGATGLGVAIPLAVWQADSASGPTLTFTVVCAVAAATVLVLFAYAVLRAHRAARQSNTHGGAAE